MIDLMEQRWYRIALAADDGAGGGAVDGGTTSDVGSEGTSQTSTESSSQPTGQGQRGAAPWDADLEELGINDPRFSEYLRTKMQPRMTQLEQQVAQYQGLVPEDIGSQFDSSTGAFEAGINILQGLATDPAATIRGLTQLFELDPQAVFELQAAVGNDPDAQQAIQEAEEQAQPEDGQDQTSPELVWARQMMQDQLEQQQAAQFDAHLADLEGQIPGFNRENYVVSLAAFNGDPNAALNFYINNLHNAAANATAAPPNPTLGQTAGVAPTEAPQYGSLKEAIAAEFAEQRQLRNSVG